MWGGLEEARATYNQHFLRVIMKEYSSYDFNWNTFQIHWQKKLSYGVRCQYLWISLILWQASVEKIKGKIVVKKCHGPIYSHFVRAEFCTPCTVPQAKENRKWWQEPETRKQAVLHIPSCTPGQCTRVTEDMRNAVPLDQSGCIFEEVKSSYTSNQLVHMLLLALNFIWRRIE